MSTLEDKFQELDKTLAYTDDLRTQLLNKTHAAAMKLDLNGDMSASILESRIGAISAVDSLLKSKEAASVTGIKLAISNKAADTAEANQELIAGVLQSISLTSPTQAPIEGASRALGELVVEDIDKQITPGELEVTDSDLEDFDVN